MIILFALFAYIATFNSSIIFNDKVYFMHIPKNAGTTMESFFKTHGIMLGEHANYPRNWKLPICSPWHIPPKYCRYINFKNHELSFCILRDPVERFVSEANYRNVKDINHFVKSNLKLKNGKPVINYNYDCHLLPQSEFIYDYYGNRIKEIIPFKNLSKELNKLIKKYDFDFEFVDEKKNMSKQIHSVSDLTQENIEIIKLYYAEDYKLIESVF